MDVCSLPLSLLVYTTKVHKVFRDEEALLVLSVLVVVLVISLALEKLVAPFHTPLYTSMYTENVGRNGLRRSRSLCL